MSLSGRSLFSSKGELKEKSCLLLAWLVYCSQTFLVQNIKATQSTVLQCWTPPKVKSSWGLIRGNTLNPVQRHFVVILLSSVLPSHWVQLSLAKPQCRTACTLYTFKNLTKQVFQILENPTLPELFLGSSVSFHKSKSIYIWSEAVT